MVSFFSRLLFYKNKIIFLAESKDLTIVIIEMNTLEYVKIENVFVSENKLKITEHGVNKKY